MFHKYKNKDIDLFGDFNAKHKCWNCEKSNGNGHKLNENGFEIIHSLFETSKNSKSVINFCITKNKKNKNWQVERLNGRIFDPYSILFFSSFAAADNGVFRKTN